MNRPAQFEQMTVIGLGLIGSSVARAVHARGVASVIVGCDVSDVALTYARKHDFIDRASHDPVSAVSGSDLVILAVSPSALEETARAMAPSLRPGALVMDTASVKQAALAAIGPHIPAGVDFIPAHPIAGSEHSGISAGRADLFERRKVVVTPQQPLLSPVLQRANAFWEALGARVEGIPPELHDRIYAYVSHLPQLLAFAAARTLAGLPVPQDEVMPRFLRLSASGTTLWGDIFTSNREAMLAALERYLDALHHIVRELAQAPQPDDARVDAGERPLLFARIAASCLITTVMEAERQMGFPLARYAGTGFADFASPATSQPDNDIERISGMPQAVSAMLVKYLETLAEFQSALEKDAPAMEKALTSSRP